MITDYLKHRKGYTHFWSCKTMIDPKVWNLFAAESRRLIRHYAHLVNEDTVSIQFSGSQRQLTFVPLTADEHGNFLFTQMPQAFVYCRTNYYPADALITAVLLSAKKHLGPLLTLTSDGLWDLWEPGRMACREVLNYKDVDFDGAKADFDSYLLPNDL